MSGVHTHARRGGEFDPLWTSLSNTSDTHGTRLISTMALPSSSFLLLVLHPSSQTTSRPLLTLLDLTHDPQRSTRPPSLLSFSAKGVEVIRRLSQLVTCCSAAPPTIFHDRLPALVSAMRVLCHPASPAQPGPARRRWLVVCGPRPVLNPMPGSDFHHRGRMRPLERCLRIGHGGTSALLRRRRRRRKRTTLDWARCVPH